MMEANTNIKIDSSTELDENIKKELDKVNAYLTYASSYNLSNEVVLTALKLVKDVPQLYKNNITLALYDALYEWDILK